MVYRIGKHIKGAFYVISIGVIANSQLVVEAYEKLQETRIVLRIDWSP